jgi:hypothetical protein
MSHLLAKKKPVTPKGVATKVKTGGVKKPVAMKKKAPLAKARANDVAMSRFNRASARRLSPKRKLVRPPLLGKKEATLAGGQSVYESPFSTGLASLSGQRFSIGQQKDAYKRDPQTTTKKANFKKTTGKYPADYATNVKKLGRPGLAELSKSFKDRSANKALKPKSADVATSSDRLQTTLAAIMHDSEPLRGNLAKEGRGAVAALAEPNLKKRKKLADVAKKDGVTKPKSYDSDDDDHKRWMAEVMHKAAPFTAPEGGSAHEDLRTKKRKMTHTQSHIWEQGYVSASSDEDEPDPHDLTQRRKAAKMPKLAFPSSAKVKDAVEQVAKEKAKAKKKNDGPPKKKAKTK